MTTTIRMIQTTLAGALAVAALGITATSAEAGTSWYSNPNATVPPVPRPPPGQGRALSWR